ncbi:HesA/MoeB/ThiF family protein [Cytobacillus sp. Hm23]
MKPIFKPLHPIIKMNNNEIRIGSTPETSFDLEDPDGAIYTLLSELDGQKEVSHIRDILHEKGYTSVTYEEIVDTIQELEKLGFITDTNHRNHTNLSDWEIERFRGNLNFFSQYSDLTTSTYKYQEKICDAKVTILGMGAFGSSVLIQLAGLGVKNVRIVDFDHVSLSNLNRQILFNESTLGKQKIDVAKNHINNFYSDMNIEIYERVLSKKEDISPLISGSDMVVLAADQPYILLPREVNKACVEQNIPFVAGGITINKGQFFTIIPNESGCLDCMHIRNLNKSETYYQSVLKVIQNNFIPPNAATAPSLMITTGMLVADIMKQLTKVENVNSAGAMQTINILNFQTETSFDWEREAGCPTCGDGSFETNFFDEIEKEKFFNREVVQR